MIKFDNFLNSNYVNALEDVILGNQFTWFLQKSTSPMIQGGVDFPNAIKDVPQFTHMFYQDEMITSDHYEFVEPIIKELEKQTEKNFLNRLFRAKANLLYNHSNYPHECFNMPHVDRSDSNIESFLYYVNDSDGDTIIFDKKENDYGVMTIKNRIAPVKGRGVLFDSGYYHASTPPRINETRVVINFLFMRV